MEDPSQYDPLMDDPTAEGYENDTAHLDGEEAHALLADEDDENRRSRRDDDGDLGPDDDQFEGDKVYPAGAEVEERVDAEDGGAAEQKTREEGERAEVKCSTSKGEITLMLHRDWSPHGYDHAAALFEQGYYDHSHFFRVVPHFLVQFGIGYTTDEKLKHLADSTIADDPRRTDLLPFKEGYISYAGSGPNSRSSQLFIAYDKAESLGESPWETPFGTVESGMDHVRHLYGGYGDMPPWGKGPEQGPIRNRGSSYIESGFPLLDKFGVCAVRRITGAGEVEPRARGSAQESAAQHAGATSAGEESKRLRVTPAFQTKDDSRAESEASGDPSSSSAAIKIGLVLAGSALLFAAVAYRLVARGRKDKEGKKL